MSDELFNSVIIFIFILTIGYTIYSIINFIVKKRFWLALIIVLLMALSIWLFIKIEVLYAFIINALVCLAFNIKFSNMNNFITPKKQILKWVLFSAMVVLILLAYIPWSNDVYFDLNSGRGRYRLFICGIKVTEEISETNFSKLREAYYPPTKPPQWIYCWSNEYKNLTQVISDGFCILPELEYIMPRYFIMKSTNEAKKKEIVIKIANMLENEDYSGIKIFFYGGLSREERHAFFNEIEETYERE